MVLARAGLDTDATDGPSADPTTDAHAPSDPRRTAGLALVVVGMLLAIWPPAPLWVVLAGFSIALSAGLPLALAGNPTAARRAVPVAVVLVALVTGWGAVRSATGSGPIRYRTHDGGVFVTRAAADDLLHLRNPYAQAHGAVLPPSWKLVQGADGSKVANPVAQHYPYLPAFPMAVVPFEAVAHGVGHPFDPRLLGWLAVVGACWALARRPEPAWQRVGAIFGVGGAFTVVYLAWGTTDAFAAAMAVLALCWADRRPRLAGVALALALSAKVLLAVLVPPLALVVVGAGGWAALRRWWTLPAVLLASCVPVFAADPHAFLDDTVWFNLGKTKPLMPTSGMGLPAVAPGTFHGPVLGIVTLLGFALALAVPIWLVRRWPSVWVAGAGAGLALLGVLVPARTFQVNYLVLVAALLPLAWLAVGSDDASTPSASPS